MAYEILRRSSEEASTWIYSLNKRTAEYDWIFFPIHVASFSDAPIDLMKKVVKSFPQGLRMAATGGKLSLHVACVILASSEVITFLHNAYVF